MRDFGDGDDALINTFQTRKQTKLKTNIIVYFYSSFFSSAFFSSSPPFSSPKIAELALIIFIVTSATRKLKSLFERKEKKRKEKLTRDMNQNIQQILL